jgi:hypothetical protein
VTAAEPAESAVPVPVVPPRPTPSTTTLLPGTRRLAELAEKQRSGVSDLRREIRGAIARLEAEEAASPRRPRVRPPRERAS